MSFADGGVVVGVCWLAGRSVWFWRRWWRDRRTRILRERSRRTLIVAANRLDAEAARQKMGLQKAAPVALTGAGERFPRGLVLDGVVWCEGWWRGARADYVELEVHASMAKVPGRQVREVIL